MDTFNCVQKERTPINSEQAGGVNMKAWWWGLGALILIGCTGSVQTVDLPSTIQSKPDSGYGVIYGSESGVVYNPFCDSLRVAQEILRRAMADLHGQAESYRVKLGAVIDGTRIERQSYGRAIDSLVRRIDYFRARVNVNVNEPSKPVEIPQEIIKKVADLTKERDDLIVERDEALEQVWSFWDKVQYAAAFILAGLLAGFLLPIANKIKALVGL